MATSDVRFPERDACVLDAVLRRRAAEHPDRTYAVFEGDRSWTYAETYAAARRTASALASLGVRQGDRVLSWVENGPTALRVWFGANLLGATYVPINTSYRGTLLEHVVNNSEARVMVGHGALLDRLGGLRLDRLDTVVAMGGEPVAPTGTTVLDETFLDAHGDDPPAPERAVEPWDEQSIIYTSGTTGPSKGVLSSYLHLYSASMIGMGSTLSESDRYMVNLPLFHVGGTIGAYGMLLLGGSITVVSAFDTNSFWKIVDDTGTTACTLLGVMATFLAKQPPQPDDATHGLRLVYMIPLTDDASSFGERFGLDVYTMYNMTELSIPIVSERNPTALGTCGKARPGIEARIVDEHDREVSVGTVGELILRADTPWSMMHGYCGMPDATAQAWRIGWFHTGDALRRDDEGNYFFVDRLKDAIRRRGENVSSFEVEAEVCTFPAIREAVAVGVPSEYGEDEILVVAAAAPGAEIDPTSLIEYLLPRMPYFMVPRYVRIVDELPKTPTSKVQKNVLREQGLTPDTWDREAAGIKLRRERLDEAK